MASSSSTKGSDRQQIIAENKQNLEEFVRYFVKEFESKLTAYHMILEGEKNENKEDSNTFSEAVGEIAGGLAGGIVGYFLGAMGTGNAAGKSIGRKLGSLVGNQMHLKEVVKLTDVLDLFLYDKAGFRHKLVEAGYEIFQSFEMQFNRVSADTVQRKAFQLLARDATNRVIDYFKEKKDASITEGVLYGKSKRETYMGFPTRNTTGYKIKYEYEGFNKEWQTSSLFEKVGLVVEGKNSTKKPTYYEKNDGKNKTEKYGYRRLFTSENWETLKKEYVTSNDKKSEQFKGYDYILKSEDSKQKINDILNKINLDDSTLDGVRLTEIMTKVKGEVKEVLNGFKKQIALSEEDHKILEGIETSVRNLNLNDFLKKFKEYSKQATEERQEIKKSVEGIREETKKYYDQSNKKQDIYHDDYRREHKKIQDGIGRVEQRIDSSGKKIDEIHRVIVSELNQEKESIWFGVKVPVQQFTGRKEELNDLNSKIQRSSGKPTVISQMTSISGLGGIGKTELARQYVHEHQKDYDDVIWINAENEVTLTESFMRLAKDELGIKTKNADGEEKDKKSIVKEVYKYFDKSTILFIFDNAENHKYLSEFLPLHCKKADAKIPYILFTSRNREWEKGIQVILLNELTPDDAMELVKKGLSIEDESQDKDIQKLVEKLQYFPLALQQAISYIEYQKQIGNYGISNYLKEYETRSGILLKSKVFQGIENDYTKTTITTWNITLNKIENDKELGKLAVNILNIMAYISPERINRKLFLNLADGNEELLASAIRLLVKYSMVKGEQQQSILSIHRLVQETIRLQLEGQGREEKALKEVLQLMEVNPEEEIVAHSYTLQIHVKKYEELKNILIDLQHHAFSLLNFRHKSPFELLNLPDKLKLNLMIVSKSIPPNVKQESSQQGSLRSYLDTWEEHFINMKKMFGLIMHVGDVEMKHAWQFYTFQEDKDEHYIYYENLERSDRGTNTYQKLSKLSAMNESEKYGNESDLNVKDTYGNTPLHLAAQKGHLERVKCLIDEKGAHFEAKNHFGQNPIHFAAAKGHLEIVKYLIDDKNAEFDVPDYYYFTPLYLAAWNGELDVVKYLVSEKGAKIDYFDGTPINYLAKLGDTNVHITDLNRTQEWLRCLQELFVTTSMHLAAMSGHLGTLRYLIDKKGADSNAKDIFGSTPLHSASKNGQLEVVEYLVNEKGGDVNVRNAFHSTPVHLAAQNGHLDTLKYLIDKKQASFDIQNQLSIYPLHLAAKNGHLDVLEYVTNHQNVRTDVLDYEKNNPMHYAALNGELAIVKYLINEKRIDINITNGRGHPSLHLATWTGHKDIVKYLIDNKNADYNVANAMGETPLHFAARNGHLDILKYLIDDKNSDFNIRNVEKETPLHLAARSGHMDMLKYLIDDKNADINIINNKSETLLHLAAIDGHLDIVRYLVNDKNADFNIINVNNGTPLHLAAWNGHLEVVRYLIHDRNADFNIRNDDMETPIHLAAMNGHLEVVRYLIDDKNAAFNRINVNNETPLHLAARNGHLEVMRYLIDEKNANFKIINVNNETPLHLSARNGHLDIVRYLIDDRNADFNIISVNNETPLHLAAKSGHLDIVRYLIDDRNADFNIRNDDMETPLHLAAEYGYLDILKYLIDEKNSDFDIINKHSETPLHLAAEYGNLEIVNYLIHDKNADFNIRNDARETLLHLAARNGHLDILKYLIDEKNADFNIKNVNNETPLHLASKNGKKAIVRYLIDDKNAIK